MRKVVIIASILIFGLSIFGQIPDRPSPPTGIRVPVADWEFNHIPRRNRRLIKENKETRAFKKISKAEKATHKSFLKQSKTGIFRLKPDFDCETKLVVRVSGDCEGFLPGLWAYSLRRKAYSSKSFQDISLKGDQLVSDGFLSQGILVELEEKNLDKISLNDTALNYLVNFEPETELKLIGQQYKTISNGVRENNFFYSNRLKLNPDSTYALRVIAYRYKDRKFRRFLYSTKKQTTNEVRNFAAAKYDKRNDSIYVFKVIRSEKNNKDVKILWKRLDKKKSPKIIFEKYQKLKDFKSNT